MATDQHPATQPTDRQRASIARAILQMGAQRYEFSETIRLNFGALEYLSKQAEDLHMRINRLEEADVKKRATLSPDELIKYDTEKEALVQLGWDWTTYLVYADEKKILGISDEDFRALVESLNKENADAIHPISMVFHASKMMFDPYRERLPAFVAPLSRMRADIAKLSGDDLSGCDFIDRSIVRTLDQATCERDLRGVASARDSLSALLDIVDGAQDQLEAWAKGTHRAAEGTEQVAKKSQWHSLSDLVAMYTLSSDESALVKLLMSSGATKQTTLATDAEWSRDKVEKILKGLSGKGLVAQVYARGPWELTDACRKA